MLAKISTLKFLALSGHKFTEVISTNMALFVHQTINLEYLNLSRCDIENIKCFKCLESLKSLRSLDFSFDILSDEAAVTIANVISNNVALNCISLSKCALTDFGIMKILNSMQNHCYFTSDDLSYNKTIDKVAFELAAVTYKNNKMETLCISNCNLQQKGFCAILKALQQTRTLKCIDISGNTITNKVGSELISLLRVATTLECMNLLNCQLDEEVLLKICTALSETTSLKCLKLGSCKLNSSAVSAIESIIVRNAFLEHLVLSKCCVEFPHLISMLMVRPEAMKHIDFGSNVSSSQPGATTIRGEQCRLPRIEHLDFSNCNLKEADVSTICKTISTTKTLRYLNLSDNVGVTNESVTILVKAFVATCILNVLTFAIAMCKIKTRKLF